MDKLIGRLAHAYKYIKNNGERMAAESLARERATVGRGNAARAARMALAASIRSHTKAEWCAVRDFYGSRCLCCGTAEAITKDHVTPVSMGGSDGPDNLQPLCFACNCAKLREDFRWDSGEWACVAALTTVVGE